MTFGYRKVFTYTHSWGFLVARFDYPGNAKALHCGTSNRTCSTFFLSVGKENYTTSRKGSIAAM